MIGAWYRTEAPPLSFIFALRGKKLCHPWSILMIHDLHSFLSNYSHSCVPYCIFSVTEYSSLKNHCILPYLFLAARLNKVFTFNLGEPNDESSLTSIYNIHSTKAHHDCCSLNTEKLYKSLFPLTTAAGRLLLHFQWPENSLETTKQAREM